MDLKEFLKPDYRKILIFLLPIIFLLAMEFFNKMSNLSEFNFLESLDYVFFKFPCFIESNLLCEENCCFESMQTRIISSLMFYIIWFLYSWFIIYFNDKVHLKGLLWRKMYEEQTDIMKPKRFIEEQKEIKEEHKPEVKHKEIELPKGSVSTEELMEQQQYIKEQEEVIKEEKEKIGKFIDEINKKKLMDMGFDLSQNMIRCSKCGRWKNVSKKELANKVKKHGIEIIWKYVCSECDRKRKKK